MDALLWRGGWTAFEDAEAVPGDVVAACRSAGMRCLVEVDVTRFPLDHPLVAQQPDLFAIRRVGASGQAVDPRKPMPPSGEALARMQEPAAAKVLGAAIGQRLAEVAAKGVGGFRLLSAERLNAATLVAIAGALGDDVVLIAGPFGEDRSAGVALAGAGLDALVSSFAWWDLQAAWLLDEAETLGAAAPLLAEVRAAQAGGGEATFDRLLAAAAVTASGIIVPEPLLARSPDGMASLTRAIGIVKRAGDYTGAMRRLSAGAVTTLLRADTADLRSMTGALIALINTTEAEQPAPSAAALIERAGRALDLGEADLSPLAAGEVRVIEALVAKTVAMASVDDVASATAAGAWARLVVEDVTPNVAGGDFAVKRVVGEQVPVTAVIYADGHEQLAAELRWRAKDEDAWRSAAMVAGANDVWTADFPLERLGAYEFVVEGWLDRFGGFRRDFGKKRDVGVDQAADHAEGQLLIAEAMSRTTGSLKNELKTFHTALDTTDEAKSAGLLLDERLAELMHAADDRRHALTSSPQRVDAERLAARYSSWYELFPRSMTDDKSRHGTFADVIEQLPRVRDMGFDTLYFPPIHPIGTANRKGPNNTLTPEPHDVGSPYAIGSPDGGHDAIHPELGSFEDFDRLVAAASAHGLEIALDFAIQASPDHPWLTEHPGWFAWRPDGSMKYAENPPKKYQDIVNVDFYGPDAVPGLWQGLRDVVLLWIEHGVKTFRVDNPHTKPLPFWEWMIADVRAKHPDAIFLAEAFTRPTMMYRLAKAGFSQSYTYFTWRDGKQELTDYIVELSTTAPRDFYRPHFFVNTPDINPVFLQTSGRPGFLIRGVLAATLSGLFGVYSGFELCEAAALPGKEEYLDSEKYEIRPRDYDAPGNIVGEITMLNRLRRAHPALQTHLNTRFYTAHNDNVIWYGKPSADGAEMIMVMVSLDPASRAGMRFRCALVGIRVA